MKKGNIFWGIVLVTIGVIFALRNFDIFFFNWRGLFRLWPLIFIFWGIAILPVKSMIKGILTLATIVIAIIILATNPGPRYFWFDGWHDKFSYEYDHDNDQYEDEDKVDYDSYDQYSWEEQFIDEAFDINTQIVHLNIDAVAGSFAIKESCSKLFEFISEGDIGPYNVLTMSDNEKTTIDIEHKHRIRRSGDVTNEVRLSLNPNPVWTFNVDVGAAELEMDLSNFKVDKVDLDGGAADIEIKIGDRYAESRLIIDAGAADIKILVPFESAVEIRTSTILASKDFDGFNKIKSGLYQTPNFSDAVNQIYIDIDAAVSGLKVDRY
jgi:hypothetical protein